MAQRKNANRWLAMEITIKDDCRVRTDDSATLRRRGKNGLGEKMVLDASSG